MAGLGARETIWNISSAKLLHPGLSLRCGAKDGRRRFGGRRYEEGSRRVGFPEIRDLGGVGLVA